MKPLFVLQFGLLLCFSAFANTITVKNMVEFNAANKAAKPGDVIVLKNGEWNNVQMDINCQGTKVQPITFKAQDAGKVLITGHSQLKLGGSFIIIDGLYFTNGYAGKNDAVIDFRINKKQMATDCRVTNTVINDFNNPKRMDENYWVSFSGKNNRIDHCSFLNKKNMGVLMAVMLDDEKCRENFHSIDHNYFGVRLPLASNSGEMIRVGVSEYCQYNSNTQIVDNFFEHCDGETEIVSIKSCGNLVRNNLFKECQGGVVLRHGNYNTVEDNIFYGNDKEGTGGVRIINKGQWVVNNLFYKCRGVGFRSPLSVMNGVPNSPAFRYVPVTDAVIANNSFFDCTPISLCEGSDTERSVAPKNVIFTNNIFYNDKDKLIYNVYDDISGISFIGNAVSNTVNQNLANGFIKTALTAKKVDVVQIPASALKEINNDSLKAMATTRIKNNFPATMGFADANTFLKVKANAYNNCGAKWFEKINVVVNKKPVKVNCENTAALKMQLAKKYAAPLVINLTGSTYTLNEPITILGNVSITSNKKSVNILSDKSLDNLFEIKGGSTLSLINVNFNLSGLHANNFITSDLNGSSGHSNFTIKGSSIKNVNGTFFNAAKETVLDSMIITNNSFSGIKGTILNFANETGKGLYDVEQLKIKDNHFTNNSGQILKMLRIGNDESTMGPLLIFKKNNVENCNSSKPLIDLFGTQLSFIEENHFAKSNTNGILINYEDNVRAVHLLENNAIINSGKIVSDKFVTENNNHTK
jgi:poly(beta-D-mannuronate) lyase